MINIIKNIEVYSPEYLGKKDLLFAFGKIEGLYNNLEIKSELLDINIIDGTNKLLFPGFIDSHVHVLGGGGEGGFFTRTPEIDFNELCEAGITTVVGCLGTDGVTRSLKALYGKTKELNEKGLNAYMYTGSYRLPLKTITGSIMEDITMIDNVIGTGEVAISDHRSSNPSLEELSRCIADTRIGGIISNKAGICNIHVGGGKQKIKMLFDILNNTEIPPENILPTHINRNTDIFKEGIEYVEKGGYIDFTTSSDPSNMEKDELLASDALMEYLKLGMPIENVTFSSDGNGSLPIFNEAGELINIGKCSVSSLYEEVVKCITHHKIKIQDAIKTVTSNVADRLKFKHKGYIKKDYDADFMLVDKFNYKISQVYCKGIKIK